MHDSFLAQEKSIGRLEESLSIKKLFKNEKGTSQNTN